MLPSFDFGPCIHNPAALINPLEEAQAEKALIEFADPLLRAYSRFHFALMQSEAGRAGMRRIWKLDERRWATIVMGGNEACHVNVWGPETLPEAIARADYLRAMSVTNRVPARAWVFSMA